MTKVQRCKPLCHTVSDAQFWLNTMTIDRQEILVCQRQYLKSDRAIIGQGSSLMFGHTSLDVTNVADEKGVRKANERLCR